MKLVKQCVFYEFIEMNEELNRQNKYGTKSLHNCDFTSEKCKGDPAVVIYCWKRAIRNTELVFLVVERGRKNFSARNTPGQHKKKKFWLRYNTRCP